MGKLIAGVIIGALGLYAYQRAQRPEPVPAVQTEMYGQEEAQPRTREPEPLVENDNSKFRCDGRTYCSQMTSCEEATFFLKNCPGVKMDGEGDGVPCEKQWCCRQ